jgi:hypothetical protein
MGVKWIFTYTHILAELLDEIQRNSEHEDEENAKTQVRLSLFLEIS